MVIYVTESSTDHFGLLELLKREGVFFTEKTRETTRELTTAGWRMVEFQANLPEVVPVPPQYVSAEAEARAWRLPSGRLIISDAEGNLEQITSPPSNR
jgi:hypothetical protein